jgi:hypothetical protein
MVDIDKRSAVPTPDPIKDFTVTPEIPAIDKLVIDELVILIPKHISQETFESRIDPVLHAYFKVKEFIPKGSNLPEKKSNLYG